MSAHRSSHFQPPPPIRTSTSGSQKSLGSGPQSPASDMASPTVFNRSHAASPTEESFFGAIAGRMRRGRSRSRSRGASARNRSKSPMMLPPENFPPSTTTALPSSPISPTTSTQQRRHASSASQSSAIEVKPTRPNLEAVGRRSTSGSDPWRGRHSNDWLFNGFSVTETAKDILHLGRKS
ncbi:hypothetical protein BU24DRAFT_180939 [Aaosphaeria arxii CBS 175.79]|uniref:Uncharacterized protein n=1 Tax=Aaosphaeria arxii CBS 175.79 TaxID=1450172 RepID=A0A6A5XRR1_9PLEO|nr:uncharacterized protein BU24DRAFT_180939 [Aaosphaeria arxii CBS 175.79]KAF2015586.1 hypothetical protein BU24DRAFT_180939 [Aaosphaeria arxii CBS 175.79]